MKHQSWEKEFDKDYYRLGWHTPEEVKSFIRHQLAEAEKRGYEKGVKQKDGWGQRAEKIGYKLGRQQARKELIEEIEKWAKEYEKHYWSGTKNTIKALLAKLTQLK